MLGRWCFFLQTFGIFQPVVGSITWWRLEFWVLWEVNQLCVYIYIHVYISLFFPTTFLAYHPSLSIWAYMIQTSDRGLFVKETHRLIPNRRREEDHVLGSILFPAILGEPFFFHNNDAHQPHLAQEQLFCSWTDPSYSKEDSHIPSQVWFIATVQIIGFGRYVAG